jgi:hypothetical protein
MMPRIRPSSPQKAIESGITVSFIQNIASVGPSKTKTIPPFGDSDVVPMRPLARSSSESATPRGSVRTGPREPEKVATPTSRPEVPIGGEELEHARSAPTIAAIKMPRVTLLSSRSPGRQRPARRIVHPEEGPVLGRSHSTASTRRSGGRLRALIPVAVAALLVAGTFGAPASAGDGPSRPRDCRNPKVPATFHKRLVTAIRVSGNLPRKWADSPYLAKIVCWQDTSFDTTFRKKGRVQAWHGVFAMTIHEAKAIAGPWLSNDRYELILNPVCFVHGWDACPHTTANSRIIQQLIAGMRWIWLIYGRPITAWEHIVRTGRFNSYPRPGTDNTATRSPLRLCPVAGVVGYRDDFGEPRSVGGYHPHSGNDIGAPTGRAIRAPFSGLVVAHSDDWFAGRYLTVVGREGFARNAHLSRFAHLGYVRAGTVIGYVGASGDARDPHDHFDWHPWNVPDPLHVAPTGFSRILDAIDPYPFLNQVCTRY